MDTNQEDEIRLYACALVVIVLIGVIRLIRG